MPGKSRRDFLKTSAIIGAGVTGISSAAKAGPKNILSEDTGWEFWSIQQFVLAAEIVNGPAKILTICL